MQRQVAVIIGAGSGRFKREQALELMKNEFEQLECRLETRIVVFDPKRRCRIQLKREGIQRAHSTPGEFAVAVTFGTLLSVTVKPALLLG